MAHWPLTRTSTIGALRKAWGCRAYPRYCRGQAYTRTMATDANALGEYLRARRQQVRPEDVGLVPGARRRVPGLRREELAMLAGISAEYYLRLEVGRDKHPSAQVIEALARALQLDAKSAQYLRQLIRRARGGHSRTGSRGLRISQSNRAVFDAGRPGQQVSRCPGGKPDRSGPVTGIHTGTELSALAPIGPRRSRALRRLGGRDRDRGEWVTGIQRSLSQRSSYAGVNC